MSKNIDNEEASIGLSEVEAFVQVVRAGGFAAAGRVLRVPRSTLSRQVARLEERLGLRLLQRTTRRIGLTEEGRAYLERVGPAVDAVREAEREVLAASDDPRGTVVLACPFDYARDWLAPQLHRFHEAYPQVALQIRVSPRRVDLIAEGVDVAIRGGVLADSSLVARRLADSDLWLVASSSYLDARGRPVTPDDLADHDCAGFAEPPGGFPFTGPDGVRPLELAGWLVINEWGSLRQVALGGAGIALVEKHGVVADLEAGRLERVLPDHAVVGGGLFAVFPSRKGLSAKVRVLVDFLAAHTVP